jgi:hypothetical protein
VSNPHLARLRLARVRCNENIARLESSLVLQRNRREAIEAAIHDLEPELRLPPPKLRPNPIFVRNEIARLALGVLRDSGEPLGVAEIAIRVLVAKGLPLPPPRIKRMTRARLRAVFTVLAKRGVVRTVGTGQEAKRELTGFNHSRSGRVIDLAEK